MHLKRQQTSVEKKPKDRKRDMTKWRRPRNWNLAIWY